MLYKLITENKRQLMIVAKLLIAIAFFFILIRNGNLKIDELSIIFINYQDFMIALLFLFFGIILSGFRWWILLAITNNKVALRTALSIQLMGSFFSSWLPGAAGGDAIRGVLLYRLFDSGRSTAFISIAVDRIFSIFGLVSVAVLSIGFIQIFTEGNEIVEHLSNAIKGMAILAFLLLIFLTLAWKVSTKWGFDQHLPVAIRSYISPIGVALSMYRKSWFLLLISAALSILASGVVILGIIVIASMFTYETDPIYIAIAGVFGNVSSVIPISPGGLGIGEAAFAKVYAELTGTTGSFATIYFTFRIGMLFVNIPGMLITFFYRTSNHR